MHIDLSRETAIPFSQAPKYIPGRPHLSTAHRWRLHGVRGVKLETFLCGGRRFTTAQAIERFIAQLNPHQPLRSSAQDADRAERVARARAELRSRNV